MLSVRLPDWKFTSHGLRVFFFSLHLVTSQSVLTFEEEEILSNLNNMQHALNQPAMTGLQEIKNKIGHKNSRDNSCTVLTNILYLFLSHYHVSPGNLSGLHGLKITSVISLHSVEKGFSLSSHGRLVLCGTWLF